MKTLETKLMGIVSDVSKAEYIQEAGQFVRSAAVLNAPAESGYLRQNIFDDFEVKDGSVVSEVYTNVEYGTYVELGTGPRGAANHTGISPDVVPTYTMDPWWIHESQIDIGIAGKYGWSFIETPQGKFYKCYGQPAKPFLYPALKDNEKEVVEIAKNGINAIMERNSK